MAKRKRQEDLRTQLLRKAFRMPLVQTIKSRKSSITNAFVNSILPVIRPTFDEIEQALAILQMTSSDVRCAYCGDKSTEWDHLRPIVVARRPTGYISEIANLVPSCGTCNESKRNEHWKSWMLSNVDRSPTARGLANIDELVLRLEAYEQWKTPTKIDFEKVLGAETYQRYWLMWERVNAEMHECQVFAASLRAQVAQAISSP